MRFDEIIFVGLVFEAVWHVESPGGRGRRSGQDGFSTLLNPPIPRIPNHFLQHFSLPSHTMDANTYITTFHAKLHSAILHAIAMKAYQAHS